MLCQNDISENNVIYLGKEKGLLDDKWGDPFHPHIPTHNIYHS